MKIYYKLIIAYEKEKTRFRVKKAAQMSSLILAFG